MQVHHPLLLLIGLTKVFKDLMDVKGSMELSELFMNRNKEEELT